VVAIVSYAVVLSVYISYVVFILRNSGTKEYVRLIDRTIAKPFVYEDLPNVTAIIPAYNEEAVVSKKLQNLAELDYPIEKIEVLLIDDCSTDRTCEIAEDMFKNLRLRGKIIRNPQRMGVNASYNNGVPNASSNLILRTDADVMIKADALRKAVQIISNIENIGGVTGTMAPVIDRITMATTVENSYRDLFDQMSTAESALYSTFPGGGGFALINKSAFSPISVDRGSTDGNISLSVIRKGFRYIYVPEIFSMEPLSHELNEQVRQKMRRASRLIQSTLMNRDVLFNRKYREFGMVIFPLRFVMFIVCPFLMFAGIFSTFYLIVSYSMILALALGVGACLLFYVGTKTKMGTLNSVASLLIQQFYLSLGLLLVGKSTSTWKSIKRGA
jgi:glycosyltransferase involved in cell wall biosynthesis